MDITIHSSFLPHEDPDESLAFYRDTMGFDVRLDVGGGKMRWITVGPPNQADTNIVLYPPDATPGVTDDERRVIHEMMAMGTFGTLLLPAFLLLSHSPFLFGYAKPVPVNFRRLKNPRIDMVWVALAGPATNIALALAAAAGFHLLGFAPANSGQWIFDNLKNAVLINVVLAIFNMMPIPPLDMTTNTEAIGLVLYTRYVYFFQAAGLVLLIAMIGAIVLTLHHKPGVKRQNIGRQNARTPDTAIEVRKVRPGEGL